MCDSCRKGYDGVCDLSHQAYGLNEDGGFQQYLLVKIYVLYYQSLKVSVLNKPQSLPIQY